MNNDPSYNEQQPSAIVGEYRLLNLLGSGGMGSVWLAEHVVLGKKFAIKFLNQEYTSHPEARARFEQEARTIGRLDHPNVVSAVNYGFASDGRPYLVLEALVGKTVRDVLIDTLVETRMPLSPQRACNLLRQACAGIGHAHQCGIVHRDLKPDNLFLAITNTGELLVKVLDFGIAKMRGDLAISNHKTQTGAVLGTPYYMSPEQARGERDIDYRTDIYSLAAILYELLSGEKPHHGDQYNALIADIITRDATPLDEAALHLPLGLSATVAKGMARARDERYQTPIDFAQALAPFFAENSLTELSNALPRAESTGSVVRTISILPYENPPPVPLPSSESKHGSSASVSAGNDVVQSGNELEECPPLYEALEGHAEQSPRLQDSINKNSSAGVSMPDRLARSPSVSLSPSVAEDSLGPSIREVAKKRSTRPALAAGAFLLAAVAIYIGFSRSSRESTAAPAAGGTISLPPTAAQANGSAAPGEASAPAPKPSQTAEASDPAKQSAPDEASASKPLPPAEPTGSEKYKPVPPATSIQSTGPATRPPPAATPARKARSTSSPSVQFPSW